MWSNRVVRLRSSNLTESRNIYGEGYGRPVFENHRPLFVHIPTLIENLISILHVMGFQKSMGFKKYGLQKSTEEGNGFITGSMRQAGFE